MDKQIVYYYQRGVASYLIAKKLGISNSAVRNILEKHGIKLRGHAITNKVSAARRTPEQNRALTAKATAASTGVVHTKLHRMRLAMSRQKNPTIDPVYEQPLVDLCKDRGVPVIPQKAFYKFNVDLYLPTKNVVIEIFGGGFHNKADAVELFNNKIKHLSTNNVPVLIVWADKLNYSPQAVLEVAMQCVEPLTIITGDGKPSVRGLNDIEIK